MKNKKTEYLFNSFMGKAPRYASGGRKKRYDAGIGDALYYQGGDIRSGLEEFGRTIKKHPFASAGIAGGLIGAPFAGYGLYNLGKKLFNHDDDLDYLRKHQKNLGEDITWEEAIRRHHIGVKKRSGKKVIVDPAMVALSDHWRNLQEQERENFLRRQDNDYYLEEGQSPEVVTSIPSVGGPPVTELEEEAQFARRWANQMQQDSDDEDIDRVQSSFSYPNFDEFSVTKEAKQFLSDWRKNNPGKVPALQKTNFPDVRKNQSSTFSDFAVPISSIQDRIDRGDDSSSISPGEWGMDLEGNPLLKKWHSPEDITSHPVVIDWQKKAFEKLKEEGNVPFMKSYGRGQLYRNPMLFGSWNMTEDAYNTMFQIIKDDEASEAMRRHPQFYNFMTDNPRFASAYIASHPNWLRPGDMKKAPMFHHPAFQPWLQKKYHEAKKAHEDQYIDVKNNPYYDKAVQYTYIDSKGKRIDARKPPFEQDTKMNFIDFDRWRMTKSGQDELFKIFGDSEYMDQLRNHPLYESVMEQYPKFRQASDQYYGNFGDTQSDSYGGQVPRYASGGKSGDKWLSRNWKYLLGGSGLLAGGGALGYGVGHLMHKDEVKKAQEQARDTAAENREISYIYNDELSQLLDRIERKRDKPITSVSDPIVFDSNENVSRPVYGPYIPPVVPPQKPKYVDKGVGVVHPRYKEKYGPKYDSSYEAQKESELAKAHDIMMSEMVGHIPGLKVGRHINFSDYLENPIVYEWPEVQQESKGGQVPRYASGGKSGDKWLSRNWKYLLGGSGLLAGGGALGYGINSLKSKAAKEEANKLLEDELVNRGVRDLEHADRLRELYELEHSADYYPSSPVRPIGGLSPFYWREGVYTQNMSPGNRGYSRKGDTDIHTVDRPYPERVFKSTGMGPSDSGTYEKQRSYKAGHFDHMAGHSHPDLYRTKVGNYVLGNNRNMDRSDMDTEADQWWGVETAGDIEQQMAKYNYASDAVMLANQLRNEYGYIPPKLSISGSLHNYHDNARSHGGYVSRYASGGRPGWFGRNWRNLATIGGGAAAAALAGVLGYKFGKSHGYFKGKDEFSTEREGLIGRLNAKMAESALRGSDITRLKLQLDKANAGNTQGKPEMSEMGVGDSNLSDYRYGADEFNGVNGPNTWLPDPTALARAVRESLPPVNMHSAAPKFSNVPQPSVGGPLMLPLSHGGSVPRYDYGGTTVGGSKDDGAGFRYLIDLIKKNPGKAAAIAGGAVGLPLGAYGLYKLYKYLKRPSDAELGRDLPDNFSGGNSSSSPDGGAGRRANPFAPSADEVLRLRDSHMYTPQNIESARNITSESARNIARESVTEAIEALRAEGLSQEEIDRIYPEQAPFPLEPNRQEIDDFEAANLDAIVDAPRQPRPSEPVVPPVEDTPENRRAAEIREMQNRRVTEVSEMLRSSPYANEYRRQTSQTPQEMIDSYFSSLGENERLAHEQLADFFVPTLDYDERRDLLPFLVELGDRRQARHRVALAPANRLAAAVGEVLASFPPRSHTFREVRSFLYNMHPRIKGSSTVPSTDPIDDINPYFEDYLDVENSLNSSAGRHKFPSGEDTDRQFMEAQNERPVSVGPGGSGGFIDLSSLNFNPNASTRTPSEFSIPYERPVSVGTGGRGGFIDLSSLNFNPNQSDIRRFILEDPNASTRTPSEFSIPYESIGGKVKRHSFGGKTKRAIDSFKKNSYLRNSYGYR